MSRRAQRRKALATGAGRDDDNPRGLYGKKLFRVFAVLGLMVILLGFGLNAWIKSYLHSDKFRILMGEKVGKALDADTRFELFEWQGMHMSSAGFSAQNDGMTRQMRAHGLQVDVSLLGVRRGVWEISHAGLSRMEVILDTRRLNNRPGEESGKHEVTERSESGWLNGLLPDRAEISALDISSLDVLLHSAAGDIRAQDVAVEMESGKAAGAYDVKLLGGVVEAPWSGSSLELQSATGTFKQGRFYLNESRFALYKRGLLGLAGEVDSGGFAFFGTLSGVEAGELVAQDWKKRITGDLDTRFKVKSALDGAETWGELELTNGTLTALPLLDRIAAYTNTERFHRLNLSEARFHYFKQADRLELTDIVIASEGLVRITGQLDVVDGRLEGEFRIGITPGTLAHIPGAETKVFLRGEKGLLWSPLRITGTLDNPKEDLSERMLVAAGERMFELVPETGKMALKFAHDTATELPVKAIETGEDVIEEGVDAVHKGADIIQEGLGGVLELLPSPTGEDE